MKKLFLVAAAFVMTISALQAQKIYSTKTAKITFFSKATLEDIEAKNSEVESKLSSNGQMVFTLLIKGFKFSNALMEDHFNENYMESSKFPKSAFKGTIENLKDVNFEKDGTYPVRVKGSLTIHGKTNEIATGGTIVVKDGKVSSDSKFSVKLKDYGIVGSKIGSNIAETINIVITSQYD